MLYNIGDNPWYSNGPRCCYVCFLLKLLRTLNFGRVLFGFTKRDSSKAPLHSLMCMVCTTSWTQSRMHWMILNANSADSYSTWMTGWLWLDDSDFGVSKLPNAAKMGEQPLMQTHQLKEYLRPATICLPGGSWYDVFCCKPEWDAKTIYRKPYKTTIGWCNFPWNLEIKEEIPPITYCNILEQTYCCFFWGPPIMWSQV